MLQSKTRKTAKRARAKGATKRPVKAGRDHSRSGPRKSKQQVVLALLWQSTGTTVAVMMKATGWQPHSVRGFLAGVVRKKLGLNLVSEASDSGRVYRIAESSTAAAMKRDAA